MLTLTGQPQRKALTESGYSLIQMAIALLVLGVLSVPFLMLYNNSQTERMTETTNDNMNDVMTALQSYKRMYGIYPCPAPMNVPRNNPAYGHEVDYLTTGACRSAAVQAIAPGSCGVAGARSVCVERAIAARLTTLTAAGASSRVIVGAIPFRLLQVDEAKTADAYGSKLIYAVTESLTDQNTFNESNGAIAIHDASTLANPATSPDGAAAFVLISTGQNKLGGYSLEGSLQRACTGTERDAQNCSAGFQSGTGKTDAVYISGLQSDTEGDSHFDDKVNYFVNQTNPLWKRSTVNEDNIETMKSSQAVGIGTTTPDASVKLDISSASTETIRITGAVSGGTPEPGKLLVDQICNTPASATDPVNCFPPSMIGSSDTNIALHCPAGQYMTGIQNLSATNRTPICAPITSLSVICSDPANPVLNGVNTDGTPVCVPVPAPGCAATTKNECGSNDISLPLTIAGGRTGWITATGSACRSVRYLCGSSGGTWGTSPSNTRGRCTWTPGATTTTNCGQACGFGYGGGTFCDTVTQPTTRCLDADITGNNFATACTCVGESATERATCRAVLGGGFPTNKYATRTRTATPPSCAISYSAWDTSACACTVPGVTTRSISAGSCPAGYSGTITQPQNFDAATCSWVNNGAQVNTCSCIVPAVTTRNVSAGSCPTGFTGTVTQPQRFDAASCSWVNNGSTVSACTCNTANVVTYGDHTCSNPTCEQPDVKDVFTATINPTTCTANAPVMTQSGSCKPRSFYWKIVRTNGSPVSSLPPGALYENDSCACGAADDVCFQRGSGNQPYLCRCQ